jgi:hypothetical protein
VDLLGDNIDIIKKNWKINGSEKMEIELLEMMSTEVADGSQLDRETYFPEEGNGKEEEMIRKTLLTRRIINFISYKKVGK